MHRFQNDHDQLSVIVNKYASDTGLPEEEVLKELESFVDQRSRLSVGGGGGKPPDEVMPCHYYSNITSLYQDNGLHGYKPGIYKVSGI